jgi:hypothetical protein
MFVLNTIDVEVRDVVDPAMVVGIREIVEQTFSHLVGTWHVHVSRSDECGRWALRIRGGFGHHVALFLAVPDRLAERVGYTLRAFLQGAVPPFPVVARRPVLVILHRSGGLPPRPPGRQVMVAKGAGAGSAFGLASRAS